MQNLLELGLRKSVQDLNVAPRHFGAPLGGLAGAKSNRGLVLSRKRRYSRYRSSTVLLVQDQRHRRGIT